METLFTEKRTKEGQDRGFPDRIGGEQELKC